jgi:hypothetical protein
MKQYAKMVAFYGTGGNTVTRLTARVDAAGRFTMPRVPPGTYRVVPESGGKFSLRSNPAMRNITCTRGTLTGIDFRIDGIEEG